MPLLISVAALKQIADARVLRTDDGQDLLEYAMLCGLIALVAVTAVTSVGNLINTVFWQTIAASF